MNNYTIRCHGPRSCEKSRRITIVPLSGIRTIEEIADEARFHLVGYIRRGELIGAVAVCHDCYKKGCLLVDEDNPPR